MSHSSAARGTRLDLAALCDYLEAVEMTLDLAAELASKAPGQGPAGGIARTVHDVHEQLVAALVEAGHGADHLAPAAPLPPLPTITIEGAITPAAAHDALSAAVSWLGREVGRRPSRVGYWSIRQAGRSLVVSLAAGPARGGA